MSDIILSVENLWKQYRLGVVGAGSLREDVGRWFAKLRGKEDPTLKIGETNDREKLKGQYVWALQDISFDVKRGEVLGIIGKNGAGKSTLLKILSKVTTPTKGVIRTKGRIASLLEVGTGFHPELTGRENIFLNGAILGMTKNDIRKKFDEIVEFSGVGKYIDTPVKRYSSGMYVRLAFAVAAHLEPEILIVDEVLAVGDAEFQKKCLGKMKDVSSEGRTVLFVSHNMAAVKNLCHSGVLMEKGALGYQGNISNVVERYILGSLINENKNSWSNKNIDENAEVDLVSVRILNSDLTVSEFIRTDEEVTIEICFRNNIDNHFLYVGIQLYTVEDIPVLASVNWPSASVNEGIYSEKQYSCGIFYAYCKIPKYFLNEGDYKVNIVILDAKNTVLKQLNEMLRFSIIDDGSMRKEYLGNWIGVVRPKLNWNTVLQKI